MNLTFNVFFYCRYKYQFNLNIKAQSINVVYVNDVRINGNARITKGVHRILLGRGGELPS